MTISTVTISKVKHAVTISKVKGAIACFFIYGPEAKIVINMCIIDHICVLFFTVLCSLLFLFLSSILKSIRFTEMLSYS